MKINFILLIFIFNGFIGNAQINLNDIDIVYGEISQEFLYSNRSYKETTYKVKTNKGIFCTYSDHSSNCIVIQHFDNELQLLKSNKIEMPFEKVTFEYFTSLDNTLLLFVAVKNKKEKRIVLYAYAVNTKNLTLEDEKNIKEIDYYSDYTRSNNIYLDMVDLFYFNFNHSKDSSKLSINNGNYCTVVDANKNVLWQKKFELLKGELYNITDEFIIDNEGNCYFLIQTNTTFKLVSCESNGTDIKYYDLNLEGIKINALKLCAEESKNIYCIGLYGIPNKKSKIKNIGNFGCCYFKISSTSNTLVASTNSPFDTEVFTEFFNKKEQRYFDKSKQKGIRMGLEKGYKMIDLFQIDKGGFYIILERFIRKYIDDSEKTYIANKLVVYLDGEGKIGWTKNIPIYFMVEARYKYSSFIPFMYKNNLFLSFNGDINSKLDERFISRPRSKNCKTNLLVFNESGEFQQKILWQQDKEHFPIRPYICRQISNNELILDTKHGYKYYRRLVKLTFNDE